MARPSANEDLSAWLDGELTESERAEIDAMLASDPELRAELDEIEAVATMLREHGAVRAPPGFHARLMERIEAEPAPGGWWAWLRRPFGLPIEGIAVAAVAFLVLLVALPVTLTTGLGTYERSAEPTSSWSPTQTGGDDDAGTAAAAPATDAVADADVPDEEQQAQRPTKAAQMRKSAPEPTPSAKPVQPAGLGTSGQDDGNGIGYGTEPVAAPPPPSAVTSTATQPDLVGSLGYEIVTYDPSATSSLQAIAAKYRGSVEDASGARVTSSAVKDGEPHTYVVHLPADNLASFGDALRALGTVREIRDEKLHSGPLIPVRVTLTYAPTPGRYSDEKALDAAPEQAH